MDSNSDFTGTHRILLPSGYMDSIEFAVDLHRDQIARVAANLDIKSLELTFAQKLIRYGLAILTVWLVPVAWITCI